MLASVPDATLQIPNAVLDGTMVDMAVPVDVETRSALSELRVKLSAANGLS